MIADIVFALDYTAGENKESGGIEKLRYPSERQWVCNVNVVCKEVGGWTLGYCGGCVEGGALADSWAGWWEEWNTTAYGT